MDRHLNTWDVGLGVWDVINFNLGTAYDFYKYYKVLYYEYYKGLSLL